jgi:hypothetical protein
MDLYHLRQGLHVIASSWDYHGGAESRVSVCGNSGRFSYHVLLWVFTLCLNSCNTLLPNLDWFESSLSCSVIFMLHVHIFGLIRHMDHVFSNSWTRINLSCQVLRVQTCWSCMNLERTEYHAVDAGFWVVLELIIGWIRFRFNLIGFSSLAIFVPSPRNPIRLYSCIQLCYQE